MELDNNEEIEFLSNSVTQDEYHNFLLNDERNSFFSTIEYRNLIACETDSEPYYFTYTRNDILLGVLPSFLRRNDEYGNVLNSLPYYGYYGGVILDPALSQDKKSVIFEKIFQKYIEFCQENNVISSNLIENPMKQNKHLYEKHYNPDMYDERISQITTFPNVSEQADEQDIEDQLMQMFEPMRRRNIRKARKEGVDFFVSRDREDLIALAKLHQQHMNAIDGNEKSIAFFESIPDLVSEDHFKVYLATFDGKKIAGLLNFYFNKTVEYYTPAYDMEFKSKQAPTLLVFEAMKDAIQDGYQRWNWGGTHKEQTGLYNYKKRWGTEDNIYHYFIKTFQGIDQIKDLNPEEIRNNFPDFYVIPFHD